MQLGSKKTTLHIFRQFLLQQLLSCSSTNSETTNKKFSKFYNQLSTYKFYSFTNALVTVFFRQNQSDWLNNFWKLRFGSFGIGF